MAGVVTNLDEFLNGLTAYEARFTVFFRKKIVRLMSEGMERLMAKTPVNTGQAVMNYVASAGAPHSGSAIAAGKAIEPTNKLTLGTEKLRGGAEAVSRSTLRGIDYTNPFKVYWISNNAPDIAGLEYGALPYAPYTPRSPRGMFAVTVQELISRLEAGSI
jgi:hypothetical protein